MIVRAEAWSAEVHSITARRNLKGVMIVSEEKFQIAREVERIAVSYGVPRDELLKLIRLGFEAGQRDGLTTHAAAVTSALHSKVV